MSWTLGKIFGIPVRLHYSMLLLPLLTMSWVSGSGLAGIVSWLGLAVLLFGSVLLHELGHALTARRFGVRTYDILLTPIGGMARVVDMPRNARQEIAIAIAGPLVSLSLAGIGFLLQFPLALLPFSIPDRMYEVLFVLVGANLMLGLFNLAPALPMDGGRVLRGILALKRDYLTATRIAARVGRMLAVVAGIYAFLTGHWSLTIIAVFVYVAAGTEVRMAEMRDARERAGGANFGPFGPFAAASGQGSGGFRWTGTWPSGQGERRAAPGRRDDGWSRGERSRRRTVINVGGKAEVISRGDPN
jgi:Zn-dependent protease